MKIFLRRYYALIVATAVLLPHARLFDFVTDDAYISFRYARNLALSGELVFNLGERVEGYTNFLWTVMLALGIKLGCRPGRAVAFPRRGSWHRRRLAVVVRMSLRLAGEQRSRWHLVAPLCSPAWAPTRAGAAAALKPSSSPFSPLLASILVLGEVTMGQGCASAAAFAFAAMTRPEGVMFFALAALFRILTNLRRERRCCRVDSNCAWLALFLALFAPYFAWRWRYYGWPFPTPST